MHLGKRRNGDSPAAAPKEIPSRRQNVSSCSREYAKWEENIGVSPYVLLEEFPITAKVVEAAAESGKEVLGFLLKQHGDKFLITTGMIETAIRNKRVGKEIVTLFSEQRGKGVVRAAENSGKKTVELLLLTKGR
ncbi:uncharacterized protein BDR25DRAFT_317941 [Lindgomyces ingoldianus]|uniref:Uncharacterized protein n=1 Tax=Lindgomyces ingoldianus TaxID=673940 RepID=A0ACB6QGM6_9PLEO|nr:uncharacterized protein BDR25DRAFT_317941 [Lindgomyces ingoldianus]KAF2466144.1 hypothetical protein BDR25DRAFT_317941 [Lindgomyces ingoldianus]